MAQHAFGEAGLLWLWQASFISINIFSSRRKQHFFLSRLLLFHCLGVVHFSDFRLQISTFNQSIFLQSCSIRTFFCFRCDWFLGFSTKVHLTSLETRSALAYTSQFRLQWDQDPLRNSSAINSSTAFTSFQGTTNFFQNTVESILS